MNQKNRTQRAIFLYISKKSSTFATVFGLSENLRDVAQPGSATVWGTGGRKFKSCHPDKIICTTEEE